LHELIAVVLQSATGIVLPACIVRWDERRLSPERLRRAWPAASFWCAVVAFGIFCLPIHFLRTRGFLKGLGMGLAWLAAGAVVLAGIGLVLGS
jgi:hypothetical protein